MISGVNNRNLRATTKNPCLVQHMATLTKSYRSNNHGGIHMPVHPSPDPTSFLMDLLGGNETWTTHRNGNLKFFPCLSRGVDRDMKISSIRGVLCPCIRSLLFQGGQVGGAWSTEPGARSQWAQQSSSWAQACFVQVSKEFLWAQCLRVLCWKEGPFSWKLPTKNTSLPQLCDFILNYGLFVACFLMRTIISKTSTLEPLKGFLLCLICPKISAWWTPSFQPGLCLKLPPPRGLPSPPSQNWGIPS